MKYISRAVKYYLYLIIILALIIAALKVSGFVQGDLQSMFTNGYKSIWEIALVMAVLAGLYPMFGFSTRTAFLRGPMEELRPTINRVMENMGYSLEKEEDGKLMYRRRSGVSRIMKMCEDRITISQTAAGVDLEGLTRDLPRLISALEATQEDA